MQSKKEKTFWKAIELAIGEGLIILAIVTMPTAAMAKTKIEKINSKFANEEKTEELSGEELSDIEVPLDKGEKEAWTPKKLLKKNGKKTGELSDQELGCFKTQKLMLESVAGEPEYKKEFNQIEKVEFDMSVKSMKGKGKKSALQEDEVETKSEKSAQKYSDEVLRSGVDIEFDEKRMIDGKTKKQTKVILKFGWDNDSKKCHLIPSKKIFEAVKKISDGSGKIGSGKYQKEMSDEEEFYDKNSNPNSKGVVDAPISDKARR